MNKKPKIDYTKEIEKISKPLFAFSKKLSKTNEDAEDLFQDTMLLIFENIDSFSDGTNFKGWCYTIMRNCFISKVRKKSIDQVIIKGSPADDFLEHSTLHNFNNGLEDLKMDDLLKLIDQIPEKNSTPFLLFFEGYQYHEIGEQLNLPIGTIKSRIHFARKELQNKINF